MRNTIRLTLSIVIYTLLISSAICFLTTSAAASDYIGNFERVPAVEGRPPQVAAWRVTPVVIVCDYAPISHTQINSAVSFWKRLGYPFFRTQYKHDPAGKCRNPNPKGYIVVHLVTAGVKMEESALAQTHFYVNNNTNEIEWAIIYMRTDVRATVLEHELGHALGFLHYNQLNHLMNEKLTRGGWGVDGLENKRQ